MNNMKFNVAFAALLVAGIIAMLSGFVANKLVSPEELAEDAVAIEAADAGGGAGAAKVAMPEPILALIATADIERGKSVSKACAACHSFEKGGPNGVGPGLYGVVGAKKDAHAGYAYSGKLEATGGDVWTLNELNHFLWKPKAYAPGTKMNFVGIKKPEDRAALIAWLRTVSDSPVPLPSEADIAAEQAELAPPAATPEAAPAGAQDAAPVTGSEAAPADKPAAPAGH